MYEKEQKDENKKVTLHYMKKNAKDDKPFSLNAHFRERVLQWRVKNST